MCSSLQTQKTEDSTLRRPKTLSMSLCVEKVPQITLLPKLRQRCSLFMSYSSVLQLLSKTPNPFRSVECCSVDIDPDLTPLWRWSSRGNFSVGSHNAEQLRVTSDSFVVKKAVADIIYIIFSMSAF